MALPVPLERLRRPEYTGANRCLPCTAVNAVIALAAGALVGVLSPITGATVFAVSLAAIYLRGYLVPGTPELTKRYLPASVLRLFGKAPPSGQAGGTAFGVPDADDPTGGDGSIDPERTLAVAGVLVECDDADDVCLTDAFRTEWREAVQTYRDDEDRRRDRLGALVGHDPDQVRVQTPGDGAVSVRAGEGMGREVGHWLSRGALLADLGAAAALAEHDSGWAERPAAERNQLLAALRVFVDTCPECDAPVALGEEAVESCCWSGTVITVRCDDCGARFLELDADAVPDA